MPSQCLVAGARIPATVTSDRNHTVSPGTNHSRKDSSRRPPRWLRPDLRSPRPASRRDLLRVPARPAPSPSRHEPGTASDAAAMHLPGPQPSPPPASRPLLGPRPGSQPAGGGRQDPGGTGPQSAHLGGRGPGGHLVSPVPQDAPRTRDSSPPATGSSRSCPDKHLPGASGAGALERPGPRGGDSTRTKVRAAPAPPGAPRGARPAGTSLRARRPQPRHRHEPARSTLGSTEPSAARPPAPCEPLPHVTSQERAATTGRGVGGLSRRRQPRTATQTCQPDPAH